MVAMAVTTPATIFAALGDSTRLALLVALRSGGTRSIARLAAASGMTRQAVTKHLAVLEEAGLVVAQKRGREKLHFLNPVPIHDIAERWIAKFERGRLQALADLKRELEGKDRG